MRRAGLAGHDRALTVPGHVTSTTRGPWVAASSPVPPRADGFSPWGYRLVWRGRLGEGVQGENQGGEGGGASWTRPAYGARDRPGSPAARVAEARGEESDDEAGPAGGEAEPARPKTPADSSRGGVPGRRLRRRRE